MASRIVQFGTFQADLDSGELYRDGIKLKLGGQPFQLLEHLLSRPGEVVTREELRAAVWQSDTFVDFDHGLNAAINKIREALGDSAANPRFVETVPRRGYRFIAPVDKPVAPTPVEPPPSPPPQPPKTPSRKWIGLAAGGAGVALLAAGLLIFRSRPSVPVDYKLTQVTRDSGLTWQPGISADGNFVAYASDRATGKDLDVWIQHVSGSQAIRLTSASTQESYPSLSADGRTVAFQLGHGQELGIFVVPALGGSPRMLTPAGQSPQISPDGASVAFATGWLFQASEIRVVSTAGGPARTVSTGLEWATEPFWATDGRHLLVWSGRLDEHLLGLHAPRLNPKGLYDYWMVPAAGGVASKTGAAEKIWAAGGIPGVPFTQPSPTASANARGLVIVGSSGDSFDLWLSPFSGSTAPARATRITLGAGAAHPSVAAATGRIAFSRLSINPGLWVLPLEPSSGRVTGELGPAWRDNVTVRYPYVSGDGKKLVYVSPRRRSRRMDSRS